MGPMLSSLASDPSTLFSLPPASVGPGCSSNLLRFSLSQAPCTAILSTQNTLALAPSPMTQAHRGFHGSSCHLLQQVFPDHLSKVASSATFYASYYLTCACL